MKVLFITGGTVDPATRFRVTQFFPYFEAAGIRCTHRGAYGDRYNALSHTPVGPLYKLACRAKRATQTIDSRSYDIIFLQRTAFNGSAWPERLAAKRNPRIVYDFDDAVFLGASGDPDCRRQRAFAEVVQVSAHVIAGNEYLAQHTGAREKTTIVPTVIDTTRFTPGEEARDDSGRLVIGWMGTAGNFAYFPHVVPVIERILAEYPHIVFRIVSNAVYRALADHPRVEQVTWSAETELEELRSFDIGIMPLADTAWTRGKCGFKLIQYMSVGRPVVASAVGANLDIMAGSGAGHLARSPQEWSESLRNLIENAELRRELGANARRRITERYSVESVLGTLLELFEHVAAHRP